MPKKKSGIFHGEEAFRKLKKLIAAAPNRSDVRREQAIGGLVEKLCSIRETGYGSSRIETLAAELGDRRPVLVNRLLDARRLAATYNSKEFEQLLQRAEKNACVLGISQLITFASIKDRELRDEITTKCIEHKWSVKKLRKEVRELFGGKRSGGGAKLLRPASPDDALVDMSERAAEWLRRYEQIWFVGDDAIFAKDLPVKDAQRLEERLEGTHETLTDLIEALKKSSDVLKRQLGRVSGRRAKRKSK